MENLTRFFALQTRAAELPKPMGLNLRAVYVVRDQYGKPAHELVVFVNCIRAWAKTRISESGRAYTIANELMGEILEEAALYGLKSNLDFMVELGKERPELGIGKIYPLPKESLPGELLIGLPNTL